MLRFPKHSSHRKGCLKLVGPNDPILHTKCPGFFTVTREDIEEMFALMQQHGGLGLAAPQVGITPWRKWPSAPRLRQWWKRSGGG